jgi:hypothetical protein
MKDHHARWPRRILVIAVAAALVTPAPAVGGANELSRIARNDVAHFERSASPGPLNPNLGNDVAHFERSASPGPLNPYPGNDVAYFERSASPGPSNPYLVNDRAHFGDAQFPTTPVVVRVGAGFDWASAGVGALGMLGLSLVLVVGASALRRRNNVGAATT